MKGKVIFDLVLLVLWVVVIFVVSSIPGQVLSDIQNKPRILFVRKLISDPVMHFLEYAILTFLLARFCSNFAIGILVPLYAIAGAVFIALCDEFYQYIIPKRGFEIKDLLMDALGIITVVLFYFR